jgi:glycosyltransferase involved in cell wall biosynthesis
MSGTPPRVLFVSALDASQKFGSFEEEITAMMAACAEKGGLLLPVFMPPQDSGAAARFTALWPTSIAVDLWSFDLARLRKLRRLILDHHINIVHWNFYDVLNPYYVSLRAVCPWVRQCFTDHFSRTPPVVRSYPPLKRRAKQVLLSGYSRTLGVSEFVVSCLREEGIWPRLGRVWHFVNPERFAPDAACRQEFRKQHRVADKIVILYVGQLIPQKGIETLLDAMRSLPEHAVVWILGEGGSRTNLESRVVREGFPHRVTFWGIQDRTEPFFQAADIAVCPSIWHEAAGLVNLEAAASGLPVVASDIGGIPEFVADRVTGLLHRPGDTAHLASRLNTLIADEALRRRFGARGRERAMNEFSPTVAIPRNMAIYDDLL